MRSAVCTLFEGHYHYGVGALINSLIRSGFQGTIWIGYRGPLPPWTKQLHEVSENHFSINGAELRFVQVVTDYHFTNFKPHFMLSVIERDPDIDSIFYFDPDICVKCEWAFFERWVICGVALAQEIVFSNMPPDHPYRSYYAQYAARAGFHAHRQLYQFFNGGFLGVKSESFNALVVWKELIDRLASEGIPVDKFGIGTNHPLNMTDQALLNVMAMVVREPLSTIGPEAMDFVPGGNIMSHATCSPKPWRKHSIIEALRGFGPSLPERSFWNNVKSPIKLFSPMALVLHLFDLKIACAISRFIRRQ